MKWKGRRKSANVDDRRGRGGGRRVAVGGGLGSIILIILVLIFGGNPEQLMQQMQTNAPASQQYEGTAEENELADFIAVVLADTEDVWNQVFQRNGKTYREPGLVIFTGSDVSACGSASAATGPFYCPADEKIYIDLSFFYELRDRFDAPGDFAMAYVIAHEVGHHVQNLLGVSRQVQSMRGQVSRAQYNELSVRLELQADFYAGIWANYGDKMSNFLEAGDIAEAIGAANAIGDDRLQKQSQGYVVPDSFTHGTSEQRKRWFTKGYQTGDLSQGNTFEAENL